MVWPTVVSIAGEAVQRLRFGPGIVLGGGIRSVCTTNWVYVYLVILLADLLLLVSFVTTAGIVFAGLARTGGEEDHSAFEKAGKWRYTGIAIVVVGTVVKWVDFHIEQQTYGMTIGSYLVAAGVALMLLRHLLAPGVFIAGSATAMAVIFFLQGATYASLVLNLAVWLPVFGLVAASFSLKQVERNLRMASLGIPIILALFAIFSSALEVPLGLHFSVYHKPTSERMADFPEYLQAPPGATNVRYLSGDSPHLTFAIEDPYPANKTLNFISSHLEQAGWKRAERRVLWPGLFDRRIEGWSHLAEYPGEDFKCCVWTADWTNDRDESLTVWLTYRVPAEVECRKEDLTTLSCSLSQRRLRQWELDATERAGLPGTSANEPN
ncbi:MAG: hypothetical protein ACYTBJ_10050 [Planctomycetota bacterium]|jgi:hypothetical protein